jgi:hypothetical protein
MIIKLFPLLTMELSFLLALLFASITSPTGQRPPQNNKPLNGAKGLRSAFLFATYKHRLMVHIIPSATTNWFTKGLISLLFTNDYIIKIHNR